MSNLNQDIFDTKKTDDLPSDLLKSLRKKDLNEETKKLLTLFELKPYLSIDEIIIGMFRKYKIVKSRVWAMSATYRLSKRNILKRSNRKGESKGKIWEINNV